jgi:hypothetical protein
MNNKKQFRAFLQSYGFKNDKVLSTLHLIPRYMKDTQGNAHLVGNIHVCIYGGKGTSENDLGCVTFSYLSKTKQNGKRLIQDRSELFKKAFVAKNADHAINEFKQWHEYTKNELNTWKTIM